MAWQRAERFVRTAPDLDLLERDLRTGSDVIVDLDRARAAYRALQLDVDAAGLAASVVAMLEVGAGSLDQARLRVLDLDAAGRAAENATNQLNSARGLAFDELEACFP